MSEQCITAHTGSKTPVNKGALIARAFYDSICTILEILDNGLVWSYSVASHSSFLVLKISHSRVNFFAVQIYP